MDLADLKAKAEKATPGPWLSAADPSTVLALIARVEAAEAKIARALAECQVPSAGRLDIARILTEGSAS